MSSSGPPPLPIAGMLLRLFVRDRYHGYCPVNNVSCFTLTKVRQRVSVHCKEQLRGCQTNTDVGSVMSELQVCSRQNLVPSSSSCCAHRPFHLPPPANVWKVMSSWLPAARRRQTPCASAFPHANSGAGSARTRSCAWISTTSRRARHTFQRPPAHPTGQSQAIAFS